MASKWAYDGILRSTLSLELTLEIDPVIITSSLNAGSLGIGFESSLALDPVAAIAFSMTGVVATPVD